MPLRSLFKDSSEMIINPALTLIFYYFTNNLCYLCYFYGYNCYFCNKNDNINSVFNGNFSILGVLDL